jgi:hypothetical protein
VGVKRNDGVRLERGLCAPLGAEETLRRQLQKGKTIITNEDNVLT